MPKQLKPKWTRSLIQLASGTFAPKDLEKNMNVMSKSHCQLFLFLNIKMLM